MLITVIAYTDDMLIIFPGISTSVIILCKRKKTVVTIFTPETKGKTTLLVHNMMLITNSLFTLQKINLEDR